MPNPSLRAIAGVGGRLLDWIAPPRCVDCDDDLGILNPALSAPHPWCAPCDRRLPLWRRIDGCPRCGTRREMRSDAAADSRKACPGCLSDGSPLHACHSLLRYEGAVRRWIPAFKQPIAFARPFGPPAQIRQAIDGLADRLVRSLRPEVGPTLDLILPVPLHPDRQQTRGFNHAWPIAQRIARGLELPTSSRLLIRTRGTSPQAALSAEERRQNLRGAFACRRKWSGGLRVGLVDDVLTTGSTLEAVADVLLEAGALEVRGLTLAATRPLLRDDARRNRIDLTADFET